MSKAAKLAELYKGVTRVDVNRKCDLCDKEAHEIIKRGLDFYSRCEEHSKDNIWRMRWKNNRTVLLEHGMFAVKGFYECPVCWKKYKTEKPFKKHLQTHSKEEFEKWVNK
ncbi:hypothetical protein [Saccharococcus caldoxylosilyticus]|uniref:C2H2-type domain-containing protein n=1 Tax=Saccharococcus caldoxylosilyticus TaxID=81408 RepID=A0A150L5T6_9BACL|nr:hypothetical protein [Parageobacillus caldoxylosilyticus]KYD07655.1 hypothetical protein B4119_3406 [Parageobacillus caldoxylosilyticus]